MTEDTGFAEPSPELPAPVDEPAAAEPADEPAGDEVQPGPEPAEDASEPPAADSTPNAPEPMPAPWLPAEGVQADVRAAILSLHERLVRGGL